MAGRGYKKVMLTNEVLEQKLLKKLGQDLGLHNPLQAGSQRWRDLEVEVKQGHEDMVEAKGRVYDAVRQGGVPDGLEMSEFEVDNLGFDDVAAIANIGFSAESSEKLRSQLGLDFPMAKGKTKATFDSDQCGKHLHMAVVTAPLASEGESYEPVVPTKALGQLIGRGDISAQELTFVIDGINDSRKTGEYRIGEEHIDRYGNVDTLTPGEGIVRTYSAAAAKRADRRAERERNVNGKKGTGIYPKPEDVMTDDAQVSEGLEMG